MLGIGWGSKISNGNIINLIDLEAIKLCRGISINFETINELEIHEELIDIDCDIYVNLININNNELKIYFDR